MTPADIALAERTRAALRHSLCRVAVSGLDGVGKSTLCAGLRDALGLPVVKHPNRPRVDLYVAKGVDLGTAQADVMSLELERAQPRAVHDRGPLCVAVIHPEAERRVRLQCLPLVDLTLFLDLPLAEARARKDDPEAELRDRDREARRYRELAARWPRTVVIDASRPPGEVLSAALAAVARAVGVAP